MDFIGDDNYDIILKLHMARSKFINKDYNYILEMINDIMGLEGDLKYKQLCDFKKVNGKVFEKKSFKKKLFSHSSKIKKKLGIELNENNKPISELRKILKTISYNLRHNKKYDYYSIITN